jgi:outer membrane immunogenic protein
MRLNRILFILGMLLLATSLSYAGGAQTVAKDPWMSDWKGLYVGAFAGYGGGDARSTSPFYAGPGYYYNWTDNSYSLNTNGLFSGGALGANWQSGRWVSGLEGEMGYLRLKGSATDPNFEPGTAPLTDTVTNIKSDVYSAAYGRFGIASGPVLLYGKGGVAILRTEASTIDPCANAAGCGTTTLNMTGSKILTGWSAGGGIEWRFRLRSRWSAKVEYAYFDFGSIETAGPSSVAGESYRQSIDVTSHTVKAGLHYHF